MPRCFCCIVQPLAKLVPWRRTVKELSALLRLIPKRPDLEKPLVRAVCAILGGFQASIPPLDDVDDVADPARAGRAAVRRQASSDNSTVGTEGGAKGDGAVGATDDAAAVKKGKVDEQKDDEDQDDDDDDDEEQDEEEEEEQEEPEEHSDEEDESAVSEADRQTQQQRRVEEGTKVVNAVQKRLLPLLMRQLINRKRRAANPTPLPGAHGPPGGRCVCHRRNHLPLKRSAALNSSKSYSRLWTSYEAQTFAHHIRRRASNPRTRGKMSVTVPGYAHNILG